MNTVCPLCTITPVPPNAKDGTCEGCKGNRHMFPINFTRPNVADEDEDGTY